MKDIKLFQKYSWILGIAIILYGISIYINYYSEINSNEAETYGVIYGITSMRTRNFSGIIYKYRFKYNGKEYFGTTTKNYPERIENGRIFKVKFSNKNPNHNEILFKHEFLRKIISINKGKRDTIYLKKN